MRRTLAVAVSALAIALAVIAVRTAAFTSRQIEVEPVAPIAVDTEGLARRLAEGLRLRTISHEDPARVETEAFRSFERLLQASYPRTHAALGKRRVAGLSLLYTWRGRDPSLAPGLLAAHQDVVPVEPGTEGDWVHPPFAGRIEDGFVWGRGAMDDKGSLFAILEAVEMLLAGGFVPERTLYLALGHDEEIGGDAGAVGMAQLLAGQEVRLDFVLDEGGVVADGVVPGVEFPVAVIGIAEKGSVGIDLVVEVAGGHSSTPPKQTAVGILSAAIGALESHPMPARIDGTTALFLEYLGPELPVPFRAVLANRWLFGALVERGFGSSPALDAMIRTSTAATIFEAGVKENVLPARARAVVNHRILPGDTVEDVVEHVRGVIDDERITLRAGVRSAPRNPSPVSRVDSPAFALLQRTVVEIFPGVAVVPYLVVGGTDARHYHAVADDVYRFGPFVYGADALKLAHGTNERISLENLTNAVRFYVRFLRSATGPPALAGR